MPEALDLVDVEGLLIDFLPYDPDLGPLVGGPGVGARISTELPASFRAEGRLQIFRVSSTAADGGTEHIERALIQVNGYGADKREAFTVTAAALRALRRAPSVAHEAAVVTDVARVTGPTWSPDPSTDVPRYLSSVAVTVHPIGAGSGLALDFYGGY